MIAMTIRALADARSSVDPASSTKAAAAAASGKGGARGGTFFPPFPFLFFLSSSSFSLRLEAHFSLPIYLLF